MAVYLSGCGVPGRPCSPVPRSPHLASPHSAVLCGFALIVCVVPHTDDAEAHKSGLGRRCAAHLAVPRCIPLHPAASRCIPLHPAASLTALRRTAVLLRLRAAESARVHRYDGVPEWLRCTRAAVFVSTALAASRFAHSTQCTPLRRVLCGFALIVCVVPHTDDAEAHKTGLRRRSAALAARCAHPAHQS